MIKLQSRRTHRFERTARRRRSAGSRYAAEDEETEPDPSDDEATVRLASTAMKAKKRKPWSALKKELSSRETSDLLIVIRDLHALSAENKRFLEARLSTVGETLEEYRVIIEGNMFPDVIGGMSVSLSKAQGAISEYRKATGDDLGTLDLMISYVEFGTDFTADYGDMWEGFYDSLESMFGKILAKLDSLESVSRQIFRDRVERIVETAHGMGWGYYDTIESMLTQAQEKWDDA